MKAVRIAILGLALGAGFIAYNLMASQEPQVVEVERETPRLETVDVLVAAGDLTMGTRLSPEHMKWQAFPKEAVSAGFITAETMPSATEELAGAITRAPLLAGEPFSLRKVVQAGRGGFMSAILDKGKRAVATEISAESGAGGFILPNDRVDVMLTRSGETADQPYTTETILRNVRVLAIDQVVQDQEGQQVVIGETATLELSPSQAEVLALAGRVGTISLALRPLADSSETVEARDERDQRLTLMRYGVSRQISGVQ